MQKKFLLASAILAVSLQAAAQTTATNYKGVGNGNPISGSVFCADPTALDYEGRLYVYGSNDHQQFIKNGKKGDNGYGDIKSLVVFSTDDMSNWTFHGTIDVNKLCSSWGWQFAASWAPSAVWRKHPTSGKDESFIYFANSAGSVGVLKGYSPIGPFTSPLSAPMINGNSSGVSPCKWCFDPGAVVDENGVDHVYFEAGDVHFADLNNDGMITEADRTIIGDPNPDIYGNIFTSVSFKRFKLDVNFNYSLGNDIYNYMRSQLEGGSRFMNQTTALLRRWQVEGQQTDVPRITFQDPMGNSRFSDRWIEDGSYLRLKSVTLSYDLPVKSEYLQGFQFWIQGNNLLTFTKYLGSDPEMTATSSVIGQGFDLGRLGQSRSIVAGVKINL